MTCADCLSYGACLTYNGGIARTRSMRNKAERDCGHFKNKANFVELKDCDKCKYHYRTYANYPCNACRSCYTDKFEAIEQRTEGVE